MQNTTLTSLKSPHYRANRFRPRLRIAVICLLVISLLLLSYRFRYFVFDAAPPTLVMIGVESRNAYRGKMPLNIFASDERSGLGTVTIQINHDAAKHLNLRERSNNRTIWTLDSTTLRDGEHTIAIAASDRSLWRHTTRKVLVFFVDNTPPEIRLSTESLLARQGRTLGIFVQSDEPLVELNGKLFDRIIRFYPVRSKNLYRGLIGVRITQPANRYPLLLEAKDLVGHKTKRYYQVTVGATKFARGAYIVLSPKKMSIRRDKSKSREDNAKRMNAYRNSGTIQLWNGTFIQPAEGRLTSPFGKFREYNTGDRRHHLGTDIANNVGSPIFAANDGVVTLAENLHLYGNAIIIDHGQGVSTSYNHLNKIGVTVGGTVKKGRQIGLMGASGQTTGSHLHWGMVVNGVAVDPEEWTERDFSAPNDGGNPIQ